MCRRPARMTGWTGCGAGRASCCLRPPTILGECPFRPLDSWSTSAARRERGRTPGRPCRSKGGGALRGPVGSLRALSWHAPSENGPPRPTSCSRAACEIEDEEEAGRERVRARLGLRRSGSSPFERSLVGNQRERGVRRQEEGEG